MALPVVLAVRGVRAVTPLSAEKSLQSQGIEGLSVCWVSLGTDEMWAVLN